ncbi:MAG: phosphatidylserine decarboxylase family protein [Acidobacteriota bacterium]
MAREGIAYLTVCISMAVFFFAAGYGIVSALFIVPLLFIIYFFRDPDRTPPPGEELLVSPADGKVISIETVGPSPLGVSATRISVFMSPLDVHVNRAPAAGTIERIEYARGRFKAAFDETAPHQNERNTFVLATHHGKIAFTQVAGWLARRIVCWKKPLDEVARGEKVGMIMFGSRVDLYLPSGMVPQVKLQDRVRAGETVIAKV